MTTIPFGDPGIAGFESDDYTNSVTPRMSDYPMHSESRTVGTGASLSIYEVVGFDGSGELVPAKTSATAVVPQGITLSKGEAGDTIAVALTGHFDIDALVWHADYATDADKLAAFDATGANPHIFLGKNPYNA